MWRKIQGAKYWLYSVFEYYSNNILFVFVFGHNSETQILFVFVFGQIFVHSYSLILKKTNIIHIHIRSKFWLRILFAFVFGPKNSIRSPLWQENMSTCNYSWRTVRPLDYFCHCDVFSTINLLLSFLDFLSNVFLFHTSESIICRKLPYKYIYYVCETIND